MSPRVYIRRDPAERFWSMVRKESGEACWLWQGVPGRDGYGLFGLGNGVSPERPARFAWMLANGEIPDGKVIDVICGNGLCVRIDHLVLQRQRHTTRNPVERFWEKVERCGYGCWVWHGSCDTNGYGQLNVRSNGARARIIRVHRYSWEINRGPIPDGLHVLHRCDNPPCVNPDHLFLGTARANADDRVAKGRSARGTSHGNAKLTPAEVRAARWRLAAGESRKSVALSLGVHAATASKIGQRSRWGWLK